MACRYERNTWWLPLISKNGLRIDVSVACITWEARAQTPCNTAATKIARPFARSLSANSQRLRDKMILCSAWSLRHFTPLKEPPVGRPPKNRSQGHHLAAGLVSSVAVCIWSWQRCTSACLLWGARASPSKLTFLHLGTRLFTLHVAGCCLCLVFIHTWLHERLQSLQAASGKL